MRGFLSIDIDINELQVNQCSAPTYLYEYQAIRNGKPVQHDEAFNQMDAFHESHKCHLDSMEVWTIYLPTSLLPPTQTTQNYSTSTINKTEILFQ